MASWIDDELAGCTFADVRLEKRFKTLVERLSEGVGETIPMACQDWANTKAAYRFLSNPRVGEEDILANRHEIVSATPTAWSSCFTTRPSSLFDAKSRNLSVISG
jgi:hypothetical protein